MDLWAAYYGLNGEDKSGNGRGGTLEIPNTQPVYQQCNVNGPCTTYEPEQCNAGTVTTLFDFEHVRTQLSPPAQPSLTPIPSTPHAHPLPQPRFHYTPHFTLAFGHPASRYPLQTHLHSLPPSCLPSHPLSSPPSPSSASFRCASTQVNDTVGNSCPHDWECFGEQSFDGEHPLMGGMIYGGAGCQSGYYWNTVDCEVGPWNKKMLLNSDVASTQFYQVCSSRGDLGIAGTAVSPMFVLPENVKELRYLHTGGSDSSTLELISADSANPGEVFKRNTYGEDVGRLFVRQVIDVSGLGGKKVKVKVTCVPQSNSYYNDGFAIDTVQLVVATNPPPSPPSLPPAPPSPPLAPSPSSPVPMSPPSPWQPLPSGMELKDVTTVRFTITLTMARLENQRIRQIRGVGTDVHWSGEIEKRLRVALGCTGPYQARPPPPSPAFLPLLAPNPPPRSHSLPRPQSPPPLSPPPHTLTLAPAPTLAPHRHHDTCPCCLPAPGLRHRRGAGRVEQRGHARARRRARLLAAEPRARRIRIVEGRNPRRQRCGCLQHTQAHALHVRRRHAVDYCRLDPDAHRPHGDG